jgi:hypothetical protein
VTIKHSKGVYKMFKGKIFIINFITILVFSNCTGNRIKNNELNTGETESVHENILLSIDEIEILNLAINNIAYEEYEEYGTIIISRNIVHTKTELTSQDIHIQENINDFREKYLQDISNELWQSIYSYNSQKYIIDSNTKFNVRHYRLVSISDDDFNKLFPRMSFSRIGFNNEKTEAIFEINYTIGSLFFFCYLVHLKKENNVWKIINRIMIWIS